MAPDERVFTNARLVLPDGVVAGHLWVRDDRIADVDTGGSAVAGAIDCAGDLLGPGLVELHTDNLERHLFPRPKVKWPSHAAIVAHDAEMAASGITTVLDAVRLGKGEAGADDEIYGRLIGELHEARAGDMLRVDHRLHIRAELPAEGLMEVVAPHLDAPMLRLVSLMDHSPGQRQFRDIDAWHTYMSGRYGLSGEELEAHGAAMMARAERLSEPNRAALAAACRARGIALASHDDTTVAHVDDAVALGVGVSEFPTTDEAARAARAHGLGTVAGAPNVVRGRSHSGNVAARDLAAAGLLDALSSDYVPASLLQAVFALADAGIGGLSTLWPLASAGPARLVGLEDRGTLAPGQRADLIRVRPDVAAPIVRGTWSAGVRVA